MSGFLDKKCPNCEWTEKHYESNRKEIAALRCRIAELEEIVGFKREGRLWELPAGATSKEIEKVLKKASAVTITGMSNYWSRTCEEPGAFRGARHPWNFDDNRQVITTRDPGQYGTMLVLPCTKCAQALCIFIHSTIIGDPLNMVSVYYISDRFTDDRTKKIFRRSA